MKKSHRNLSYLILMIYHLCFSYVGWSILTKKKGDAYHYWFIGRDFSAYSWTDFIGPGTEFIKLITYPFVYLDMPFWSGFLIFSSVSGFGFLLLLNLLIKIAAERKRLIIILIVVMLLPNIHLWTSIISKEAILFVPLVLLLRHLYFKRFFSATVIISFVTIAFIRPHLAFILLCSYILALFITQVFTSKQKMFILISLISSVCFVALLLSQIQDFSGGIPRILHKYSAHINYFRATNAYVPLDQYNLLYKIFTFYFRPLPFEKSGFLYTVVSIENIIMLFICSLAFCFAVRHFKKLFHSFTFVFSISFVIFYALMYVYAYANFGIIMRTKIFAMTLLYCCILEIFSSVHKRQQTETIN